MFCFCECKRERMGIQCKHCPGLFSCATHKKKIHVSRTSTIKIQPITSLQPQRTQRLCITATVSFPSHTALHGNSAVRNQTVSQTHLRPSHCEHSPNLRISNPHLKKHMNHLNGRDKGQRPSRCGPHAVAEWLEVWDQNPQMGLHTSNES